MKNSKSIDIARVIFACLIPLFHIQFSLDIVDFISQYVSRLGVPFFFRLIYNLVTLLRNAVIEQVVSPHIDDAKIVTELSEPTLNTDQDLLY